MEVIALKVFRLPFYHSFLFFRLSSDFKQPCRVQLVKHEIRTLHSPFYWDGSNCSIVCLLCSDLSTIVCLYHFFPYLSLNCSSFFALSLLITSLVFLNFSCIFLIAEIGLKRLIQVFHLGMSETRICLTTILTPGKQIQYFIINLIMTT